MLHSCKLEIEEKIQKRAAQAAPFHGRQKTAESDQRASAAEETYATAAREECPKVLTSQTL
jgi:hypothetical protein